MLRSISTAPSRSIGPPPLDRFRRARARTRALFDLLDPAAYFEKPIALRNPIVFYEGHLPGIRGQHADQERARPPRRRRSPGNDLRTRHRSRGRKRRPSRAAIRPGPGATSSSRTPTPRTRCIEDAIANGDVVRDDHPLLRDAQAVWAIVEHEEMHQETLAYMWHRVPYRVEVETGALRHAASTAVGRARREPRASGSRTASRRLGLASTTRQFAWDNELPAHRVDVRAFEVDDAERHQCRFHDVCRRRRLWRSPLVADGRLGVGEGGARDASSLLGAR